MLPFKPRVSGEKENGCRRGNIENGMTAFWQLQPYISGICTFTLCQFRQTGSGYVIALGFQYT